MDAGRMIQSWIAVAQGHIKPCRIGTGKTGTRYYTVTDILTYKAQGCTPPSLIYNH